MGNQPANDSSFNINGLYLKHYLERVEKCEDTFKDKDVETFMLHVDFIKSQITDDERLAIIDNDVVKLRESQRWKDNKDNENTQKFLEGFCTIRGCMKFLNHTLKLVKKDVEVNADQSDPEMPAE
jgi:hypothetical protein